MTLLKDLVKKYSWSNIKFRLFELYPEEKKNLFGYKDVFNKLKYKADNFRNNKKAQLMNIYIERSYNRNSKSHEFNVYGINGEKRNKRDIHWALELSTYLQWLNYSVPEKTLSKYSEVDIICYCLKEMTFCGFSEKDIQYQKILLKKDSESENIRAMKMIACRNLRELID